MGLRHLCTFVLGVEENFMQSLSSILWVFGKQKICDTNLLPIYYPFDLARFRTEEKIHTKAVFDMPKSEEELWKLFFLRKDLPRERIKLSLMLTLNRFRRLF